MPQLVVVMVPDRARRRTTPAVVPESVARQMAAEAARQRKIAEEQYARFRNAPRTLAEAFRDPGKLSAASHPT